MNTSLLDAAKEKSLEHLQNVRDYSYHNIEHTLDVVQRAKYLAEKEGLDEENIENILIAAYFHDTGFSIQYPKNEVIGAELASNFLQSQEIKEERIQSIKEIILATILFSEAKNIPEKIIQDADLDNLGRTDCFERTAAYREELKIYTDFKEENFKGFTKKLLETFHFNTLTQQWEREKQKHYNFEHFDELYPNS